MSETLSGEAIGWLREVAGDRSSYVALNQQFDSRARTVRGIDKHASEPDLQTHTRSRMIEH